MAQIVDRAPPPFGSLRAERVTASISRGLSHAHPPSDRALARCIHAYITMRHPILWTSCFTGPICHIPNMSHRPANSILSVALATTSVAPATAVSAGWLWAPPVPTCLVHSRTPTPTWPHPHLAPPPLGAVQGSSDAWLVNTSVLFGGRSLT